MKNKPNETNTNKSETKDILADSRSYYSFLSRMNKLRTSKEEENKRSLSKPGSGNCWKKGITISNSFNLLTEDRSTNGNRRDFKKYGIDLKSLNKPMVLSKFKNENNQTKVPFQKNENKPKISEISFQNDKDYNAAVCFLHNALVSLDI